jgi:cell division protein FtsW (lipid II flippase)
MQNDLGPSLIVLGIAISVLALAQPNLAPLLALGLAVLTAGLLTAWEPTARERVLSKLGEAGWENASALIQAAGV